MSKECSSSNHGKSINKVAHNLGIGARLESSGSVGNLHGTIDDVSIWQDDLTTTEVEALYWSGDGSYYPIVNASNGGYSFKITADNTVINGSVIAVPLIITSEEGYQYDTVISIQVGSVTINDPVGPDSHGYYIYDSGDLGYSLAPFYDWIEIDNDYNGPGTELNVSDSGDGNNISNSSFSIGNAPPTNASGIDPIK